MSSENKVIEYSQYSKYLKSEFIGCTSENEKINDLIRERQLKIKDYDNAVFEWIPYNQFDQIEETGENGLMTAIWRDGPLCAYNERRNAYRIYPSKTVALKCLQDSQNSIELLINKVKNYPTGNYVFLKLYGISQNPDTNDYILVLKHLKHFMLISGNKKIDDFIQKRQLKIKDYRDLMFEWIPYSQFNKIEELYKINLTMSVYSAIWRMGPLYHDHKCSRDSNREIALKFLHNSQNSVEFVINEAKKYSSKNNKFPILYGISQNPNTNDYILVFNRTSGNEKIDNFIQERQLKIKDHDDVAFEWIPYNQFDQIKEACKNSLITVCSAIWKDGPLYKVYWNSKNYTRGSNKEVTLKFLHNSQNPIEFILNEVKKYSTKFDGTRPEINELEVPKCYTDLMKRCWGSNPDKRPNAIEIHELIKSFYDFYTSSHKKDDSNAIEIRKQFKEAEIYRKSHLSSSKKNEQHPQVNYISQLLNPFITKVLQKSECLSCAILD